MMHLATHWISTLAQASETEGSEAIDLATKVEMLEAALQKLTEADTGDANLLWIVVAAILVFFMQAGFALLEGGLVRSKNTVNVIMKNYMDMGFGVIIFWLFGFALMFGNNPTGWFGMNGFIFGTFETEETLAGMSHPFAFLLFQAMFAATAATIVSGALAERIRYWPYVIGSILITGFIYPIYGSWVWGGYLGGGGWLTELNFIDFAGSTVVHSIGGWCALAGVIVLKPRLGKFDPKTKEARNIPGHSLPLFALGGFILWFGWFGFNAGSQLAADEAIGLIALNTQLSACAGMVGAIIMMGLLKKPVLITGTVNGALGGLVGITAGCANVAPGFAIVIGLLAGALVILGELFMHRLRLDDVVGAVSVHGFCGVWGTLAAGIFNTGDLFNLNQIGVQCIGILAAFAWAFPIALIGYYVLNASLGLRAGTVHEQRGLDFSEHAEVGYPEFQVDLLHSGGRG